MCKKSLSFLMLLMIAVGSMWGKTYDFQSYANSFSENTDFTSSNGRFNDIASNDFSFDGIFGTDFGTWWFRKTGGYVGLTLKENGERRLIIYDLKKGQTLTFKKKSETTLTITSSNVLNATANTTTIDDDVEYVISADGNLVLKVSNYACIYSITIEDAPTFSFADGTYTANIQDYNQFVEPTLNNTTGETPVYSSNDPKKANILGNNDVVFRGSGVVPINATVTYKGVELNAQYSVTVYDPGAWPVVNGNTCTLSGEGRLNPQTASVPGLSMEFGNISMTDPNKNTTIVQTINGNLYASTIDQNGYRHIWWVDGLPYQGSFYTFKPTVNGTLKVWVSNNTSGKTAYLIDRSAPSTKIGETSLGIATSNSPNELTFTSLTAGKTYYLCTSGETLLLNKFSYEPSFKFSANSATVSNGTITFDAISLEGVSGTVNYTTECYGNISSATLDNSGHITNINYYNDADKGGAVVVHATCEAGTATYVLTVAYNEHLWNFMVNTDPKAPQDIISDLRNNNTDWTVTYKVRQYSNKVLQYLNGPVFANASAIDGTNADYNALTAGLVITAESKAFGSNGILPDEYYTDPENKDGNINSERNVEALGLQASSISEANILTLHTNSKITIPYLNAGQYVRIKWKRHEEKKGDKIELENLSDLRGQSMDYILANNYRVRLHGEGYHVFKVVNEGSVSFTVGDNGWVNIYSIQVSNDFLDDNCYNDIVGSKVGSMDTDFVFPDAKTYNSGAEATQWTTTGGGIRGQQNISAEFSLEDLDGSSSLPATLSGTSVTTGGLFTPVGHGQLVAVSHGYTLLVSDEDYNAGNTANAEKYYLDLQRTLITVNEKGTTAQTYPYTWDFTNISTATQAALTTDASQQSGAYWSGSVASGFTPTDAYQTDFTENTEITTSSNKWNRSQTVSSSNNYYGLAEYDGLGFNTNPENGYSTSLTNIKVTTDGTGLVVSGDKAVTLNVPQVGAGYTVYVRVKENSGAEVSVGGETNTKSVDGETVYTYTTSSAEDVLVAVKNAEVKKISVTNMTKTCWFKNGSTNDYYNTDSHACDIDYSLTEYYTGNAINAYYVETPIKKDDEIIAFVLSELAQAPSNTGYIVSTKYTSDPNNADASQASNYKRPLFVPCDNDKATMVKNNVTTEAYQYGYLYPHLEKKPIVQENGYDYYVLTNLYYNISESGNSWSSQPATVPGFYKVPADDNTSLEKYRAYLRLPKATSNHVKSIPLFDFEGELIDAIDVVPAELSESSVIDMNGTFYTLQGMKVEGFPKKSGIYMQNGKKILVK